MPAARGVLEEALSVAASSAATRAGLRLDLGRLDLELGNLQRASRLLELARADAVSGQAGPILGEVLRELARAVGLLQDRERAGDLLTESLSASPRWTTRHGGPAWSDLLEAANIRFRPETIGSWARAGKLQSIKLGGRRFVRRGEVKALVAPPIPSLHRGPFERGAIRQVALVLAGILVVVLL